MHFKLAVEITSALETLFPHSFSLIYFLCYTMTAKPLNSERRKKKDHAWEAAFIIYAHFRSVVCVVHPESIQHSEDLSLFGESPSIKQWLQLNSVFIATISFHSPG